MLDLVTRMKEVDGGRRRLGLLEVVNPLEAVLPSGRRLQLDFNYDKYQISIQKNTQISKANFLKSYLDAVLLREPWREDEWG